MQQLIQKYQAGMAKEAAEIPVLKPGDTVRVTINIFEGQAENVAGLKKIHRIAAKGKERKDSKAERQQVFEGTVIGIQGQGMLQKLTVRKLSSGVGVEKTFFTHNRKVAKIEVVRHAKVRRAKLYFLRERVGKAVRLKEKRDLSKVKAAKA